MSQTPNTITAPAVTNEHVLQHSSSVTDLNRSDLFQQLFNSPFHPSTLHTNLRLAFVTLRTNQPLHISCSKHRMYPCVRSTVFLVFLFISVFAIPLKPAADKPNGLSLSEAHNTLRQALDKLWRTQEKLETALKLKAEYDVIYIKQELGKSLAGQVSLNRHARSPLTIRRESLTSSLASKKPAKMSTCQSCSTSPMSTIMPVHVSIPETTVLLQQSSCHTIEGFTLVISRCRKWS